MRPVFVTLLGTATIYACAPASELSTSVEVRDSAGVTIVHNHRPRWGEDSAWSISLTPRVTIGTFDGPGEYVLTDVAAAARQFDGDIVVVDAGAHEVRLYDRHGSFVRTIGGPGSGPGEFQDPADILLTTADSLIVWDYAYYRITRFDSAGILAGVQSVDRSAIAKAVDPPLYPGTAKLLRDGQILVRLLDKSGKATPQGTFRQQSGALRVSADFSRIDTLMFFAGIEQQGVDGPWGRTPVAAPLAMNTVVAVNSALSVVCIGEQREPGITCIDADASRTVVRWNSVPAPVTDREIGVWRDTTLAQYTQKIREDQARQFLAQVNVPTVRPPYGWIGLDRIGNLWVERSPENYLVFDPSGALLGAVILPPIDVLEIGDDYVIGIYRDELEVEYLHLHEIIK